MIFFSKPTIVSTLCVGSYCDPIAAIFGKKYGRKENGKTWAGTIAFFISAVILFTIALTIINVKINFLLIMMISALTALVERYVTFIDDNFIVPIVIATTMEIIIYFH